MNYPVWYLPETGGGFLIALIAVLHVFVSHFAVGGGLYLIYAEKKGLRESSQAILDFTRKHARFFLLVTMVFGSITGVGIWFIIALVNPAATSYLIHNFVFGWAAEWVFFVVEIAAAFVYFYTFGRMDDDTHLLVGWLYFIAAWLSLFLINGIIGAMLTPGSWADTLNFWEGFFNPSFWPALFFRTFIAIMIAACYGYFSAAFERDRDVKEEMTRFSARWALVSLLLVIPCGYWYLSVLPEQALALVMGKSPTISFMVPVGIGGALLLLLVMLLCGIFRARSNLKPVALLTLFCALAVMGSFEWIREAARRPYVINEVMYSNAIMKNDVERLNREGFLQSALWVQNREISAENRLAAGEELFIQQCYACHTVNGANNDIVALTEKMSYRALRKYIGRIHEIRYFMPPFAGTETEAGALAAYIAGELHGKDVSEPASAAAAMSGAVVFEESCSSCHAAGDLTGAMEDMDRPALAEMLATLDELSDEMEPFAGSDAERKALINYLYGLNNPDALESAPAASSADTGAVLFEDNCSMCHEAGEMAGIVEGSDAAELVQTLKTLDEFSDEMGPFEGSEDETRQLAEYLEKLPTTMGGAE